MEKEIKKKSNRKRPITKKIYFNQEELDKIDENMKELGTQNFGQYARQMMIDGQIVKVDYSIIKDLIKEINFIGNDINNIAKKTIEENKVYENDIKNLRKEMDKIWQLLKSNL